MGKVDSQSNIPSNGSLSLTLNNLNTFVEVEDAEGGGEDTWESLENDSLLPIELSDKGKERFLANWKRLKAFFKISGKYKIKSASNFPADCGIASSASSFAALTLAAFEVAQDKGKQNLEITVEELANLSREASGSSCRSLMGPWCEWSEAIEELSSVYDPIYHYVVIVDSKAKKVSSSEAHNRVTTSQLFKGRKERAEDRLYVVKEKLAKDSEEVWEQLYQICWEEFWDMHVLFETSNPAFGYMAPESLWVLNAVRTLWGKLTDGPIVTMDAGANIHFLWRKDQIELANRFKKEFEESFQVIVGNE